MPEILAPVGAQDQLIAAVRCGADAVYLGMKSFNARRNAVNFSNEELKEVVSYCHVRNVAVNVTINTLVFDDEIKKMEEAAEIAVSSGVDGVIIQDLAVLDVFRAKYPYVKRIASTQMAIHNLEGAKAAEDLGFDTVVLARELSKDEIAEIINHTSLSTEVFVHGAHCMSVSGTCYVSAMLGGRSGNRGLCAQPCRLNWKSGDREYALSLKDLSLIKHLNELSEIGVDSFKIEGRMKRPEYVAAAVLACKRSLNGEDYDEQVLKDVFSRNGFTDGYYLGKRGKEMFGVRTKEDVLSSTSALKVLEKTYEKEVQSVPLSAKVFADEKCISLELEDDRGNRVAIKKTGTQKANKHVTDMAEIKKSIEKLGGTPFFMRESGIHVSDSLFVPTSLLNGLRREALALLEEKREARLSPLYREKQTRNSHVFLNDFEDEKWARFSSIEQITSVETFDRYIVPLWELVKKHPLGVDTNRIIVELPSVIFPDNEKEVGDYLAKLKNEGYNAVYANNLYAVRLASTMGMEVHGGFGLNAVNSVALDILLGWGMKSQTLSVELSSDRIEKLSHIIPFSLIVYGRIPLMRFRACPVQASLGCKKCKGKGFLKDRFGNVFPVECSNKTSSSLLNSVPVYIGDKKKLVSDAQIFWFTVENKQDIDRVMDEFQKKDVPIFERTTGLYFREVF